MSDSVEKVRQGVKRAVEETRRAAKFALEAADAAEEALEALKGDDSSRSGSGDAN